MTSSVTADVSIDPKGGQDVSCPVRRCRAKFSGMLLGWWASGLSSSGGCVIIQDIRGCIMNAEGQVIDTCKQIGIADEGRTSNIFLEPFTCSNMLRRTWGRDKWTHPKEEHDQMQNPNGPLSTPQPFSLTSMSKGTRIGSMRCSYHTCGRRVKSNICVTELANSVTRWWGDGSSDGTNGVVMVRSSAVA